MREGKVVCRAHSSEAIKSWYQVTVAVKQPHVVGWVEGEDT